MIVRGAYATGRERSEFESQESQGADPGIGIYGLYVRRVFEEIV
jgi:hypothetical protein